VELEATESASGRLICSRYAAVLGVGLRCGDVHVQSIIYVRGRIAAAIGRRSYETIRIVGLCGTGIGGAGDPILLSGVVAEAHLSKRE
jgi:hypothetical protein